MPWLLMLKVGLPALLILGAAFHFRADRVRQEDLGAAREKIVTLEAANQRQAQLILDQNARQLETNRRLIEQIRRERERADKAERAVRDIRAQRDQITSELRASRVAWSEAVEHDHELAEFVALDVPGAVWLRLRGAAGQ